MSGILNPPAEFTTARLHLSKPRLEDAGLLFRSYTTDPDVVRYLTWRPHETEADTGDFLQSCLEMWENGSGYPYIIEQMDEPQCPIGMIDIRPFGYRVEFGYVLAKSSWGNGYMTEALTTLVDWCLDQPGIWRASAYCDLENPVSAKIMQKAGLTYEGIHRRFSIHPNVSPDPRDCEMYAKVRI